MSSKTVVLIPTYNERSNIARCLSAILKNSDADVVVIDDSSPDGTADEVRRMMREWGHGSPPSNRVHLVVREKDRGFARSYLEGFRWALARGYHVILTMDADLSHPADRIPDLVEALKAGSDVAIGSRYIPFGGIVGWGLARRFISRLGNFIARIRTKSGIRDMTSGNMAFKSQALEKVIREPVTTEGYSFLILLKVRAKRAGCRVTEVPITFTDRQQGRSKFGWKHIVEAIQVLWSARF